MKKRNTILVVERSSEKPNSAARALSDTGHWVLECPSVETACDLLEIVLVDLILCENGEGRLDGIGLTRKAREFPKYSTVPIVLLVDPDDQVAKRNAAEAGASVCLELPVNRRHVSQTVDELLPARRPGRVLTQPSPVGSIR